MPSPMERALSAGLSLARVAAGSPVTITRGASTIAATAVQGQSQKVTIGEDTETTVDAVDWLIAAAAYTHGTPAIGDIIARQVGATTYTYTVESLLVGQSCWDWSDTGKTQYRIHTRKDGAAAFDFVLLNEFDLQGNEVRY